MGSFVRRRTPPPRRTHRWPAPRSVGPATERCCQPVTEGATARIIQHYPNVVQGDWTATVGHYVGDFNICTVARHYKGQMIEEYLFTRQLADDEPDPYANEKPYVTITSPDSRLLQVSADVRPGWTCVIRGNEVGKRSATFTRAEGGKVVERLRFIAV